MTQLKLVDSVPLLKVLDATDPENPLRIAEQEQQYQRDNGVKMLGTFFTEVKCTNWLKYRFVAGADFANSQFTSFLPIYNDGNRSRTIAALSENRNNFFSTVFTNQLTFEQSFGNHNVNVIAVAEKQDAKSEGISASGQRPDNNIQVLQGISNPNGSSSLSQNSLISYVGRLNLRLRRKIPVGGFHSSGRLFQIRSWPQVGYLPFCFGGMAH